MKSQIRPTEPFDKAVWFIWMCKPVVLSLKDLKYFAVLVKNKSHAVLWYSKVAGLETISNP